MLLLLTMHQEKKYNNGNTTPLDNFSAQQRKHIFIIGVAKNYSTMKTHLCCVTIKVYNKNVFPFSKWGWKKFNNGIVSLLYKFPFYFLLRGNLAIPKGTHMRSVNSKFGSANSNTLSLITHTAHLRVLSMFS